MNKVILLFSAFMITLTGSIFTSCKKDKGCTDPISLNYDVDADKDDGSCEYAGIGGSIKIGAFPQHHGVAVRPYYAYVKFNTVNFPGTNPSSYDLVVVADSTEDHVHIEELKKGRYFIYMTGYDTVALELVSGGIPVSVTGDNDVIVPVTE